jgi:hypothetical protein
MKRTTEETIAHTVKVKGIKSDRSGINNTRAARAIITSEVCGVSQTLRNHGAKAVFTLRNGDNVVVLSRVSRKGRPTVDAKQHGFGSSTVVTFARVLGRGGKVSKVSKVCTLAEFCNKGAKYIGTVANLYNG